MLCRCVRVQVCNHPDLLDPERMEQEDFGLPELSTKLMVLDKVLPWWEAQGHHALVFTQTRCGQCSTA